MTETTLHKSENPYTRRAFIQTMLAAPLALGATVLMPEEAEAKTFWSGNNNFSIKFTVPNSWGKWLVNRGSGHWSGVVTGHYVHKSSQVGVFNYQFNVYDKGGTGKPKIKRTGSLEWKLWKGKRDVTFEAINVPLEVWESAHGQGYFTITERQAKELLKISTGGRIKYATLVKWSKAKAKKQGAKAVRAWIGAKVVKKIRFV